MNKSLVSVMIVDDHPVVIEGLRSLLEKNQLLEITGCFTSAKTALAFFEKQPADVVLLDISLPDQSGATLCASLKRLHPASCILAISNHNERSIIAQMLQNGASGYLLKNSSSAELTAAIQDALEGKLVFTEAVQHILAQGTVSPQAIPRLTRREKEVLKWVAEGLTTAAIAKQLYISPLTVETHRRNLMQKFDVNNTAALIKIAMEHQFI